MSIYICSSDTSCANLNTIGYYICISRYFFRALWANLFDKLLPFRFTASYSTGTGASNQTRELFKTFFLLYLLTVSVAEFMLVPASPVLNVYWD